MLKSYLKRISEVLKRGDAREESYYSSLEELFKAFADSINKKQIYITTSPKKTEAGNPDFRVWDGKQSIVGYIEAKKPTEENLDYIESTDQLKRYRKTFPNLILTNFFEFRLYRNGQLIDKVQIGRPFIAHKLKMVPPTEKEEAFLNLLDKFFTFSLPKTYTAESLAIELAKRTRFLKDQVIIEELKEEEEEGEGFILGFYEAFQKYLISGLTKDDFADLYAQTITYGLFAARTRSEDGFNRKLAYDYIPETIGILRDVFQFISLGKLPKQMEWVVDDISEVLATADVNQILHKFYHEGKGSDPIIHFYETFLAEYDPTEREKRGVYYTPEPVVSYIVRSLNTVLKEYFQKDMGFASEGVTVLDPASGTLTFLAEASKLALEEFTARYGTGGKENLIRDHILKNFYAFELMMAPYAIGHLKMSFLLEELGYKLQKDERFKLYLTNTLEMQELEQTSLPGMSSLAEESRLAGGVKRETPILVILGNPPYSAISSNVGEWISKEIKAYYKVDGKPLGEKNPKWLQDDYVKFIRFAQWKIDMAGEGILGFITNHSYLDNPTFRGMRQSLMSSFNEIYLLDLHGNSLKRERCPDGSKDENVFAIQQGVAISLFIKKKEGKRSTKVAHSERWGLWEDKYNWLSGNDIKTTKWQEIHPKSEFYLFIPRDEKLLDVYDEYPKVTEIFPVNSVGVVTSRDSFVIDFDSDVLKRRIMMFRDEELPTEIIRHTFGLKDKSNWKLKEVREKVVKDEEWEKAITQILYRPFDVRWIFYRDEVIERPRQEVMHHMMNGNLGLITVRQVAEGVFTHAFVTNTIIESRITLSNKGIGFLFPLYLYPDKGDMFSHESLRKPNLNPKLIQSLGEALGKEPTPEEIFYYIYSILCSNTYRTKYAEFLKIDFPKVPFTRDYDLFTKMGKYGELLTDLHLMKSKEPDTPTAKFQGSGDNRIEKGYPSYNEKEDRVYISKSQYFEGIEKGVWEYQIGGYQALGKWLKGRRGKALSLDDIKHYCKIATALKETIEVQADIDSLYPDIETEIIEFKKG